MNFTSFTSLCLLTFWIMSWNSYFGLINFSFFAPLIWNKYVSVSSNLGLSESLCSWDRPPKVCWCYSSRLSSGLSQLGSISIDEKFYKFKEFVEIGIVPFGLNYYGKLIDIYEVSSFSSSTFFGDGHVGGDLNLLSMEISCEPDLI